MYAFMILFQYLLFYYHCLKNIMMAINLLLVFADYWCLKKTSTEVNTAINSTSNSQVTTEEAKTSKSNYKNKMNEWIRSNLQNKRNVKCILCILNFIIGSTGLGQVSRAEECNQEKFF